MERNNNNNSNSIDKKNADVNHQPHGHQEGQQNNIPPVHEADGQRRSDTQSQQMSNMMQESEEQKAGRKNDEGQNERQS
jgi:hypothetical protein